MSRLSSTVIPRKSAMFWKVRAMPSSVRADGPRREMSRSAKRIVPRCGRYTPEMQLRRLVLPAPFGPTIAWIVPGATARLTSESAVTPQKLRMIPVASSSAKRPSRIGGARDGGKERKCAQEGRRIFCAKQAQGGFAGTRGTYPGGQANGRPPSRCRWTWNTSWCASRFTFTVARQPRSAMPRSFASAAATRSSLPASASSSGARSFSVATCLRGTTSRCTGACGSMSSNATTSASWWTSFAGILPSTILQNRQSDIASPPVDGTSEQPPRVEQDRDRSLVHELDLHRRAEDAGGDREPLLADQRAEPLVQRVRRLGRRRKDEARPVALARVAVERELGHDEHAAGDLGEREVHLPRCVLEHAQRRHLVGEQAGVVLPIVASHPEQHREPAADPPGRPSLDPHLRPRDPLHHRAHRLLMACAATAFNRSVHLPQPPAGLARRKRHWAVTRPGSRARRASCAPPAGRSS